MADVRCPMCSKPNPEDRDTCLYCDARLKPLLAGQGETPESTSGEKGGSDWLSGLRSTGEDSFDQEEPAAGDDLGAEDWLARLGGTEPERKIDEFGEEIEEDTLPDWFTDQGTTSTAGQGAKNIYHSEELPAEDWFTLGSDMESAPEEVFPEEPLGEEETPAEVVPAPDLYASLQEKSEEADWSSAQLEQPPSISTEEPGADEEETTGPAPSLDWFTAEPEIPVPPEEFDADAFGSGEFTQPAFSEEADISDWSTDTGESGLPAWLTSNRPEPPETGEPTQEPEIPGEEPGWLARVRARQRAEQQTDDLAREDSASAPELPDWLSTFSSTEPETEVPLEGTTTPPVVSPFTNLEEEGQEAFAWSSGGLGQTSRPAEKAAPKEEFDDTPDWLKSLHKAQEEDEQAAPAFSEGEETPDWLTKLSSPPGQAVSGSVPAFVLDEGEELPREEFQTFPAVEESAGEAPDWLAQAREEEEEQAAPSLEEEAGEELARANLPTWLEAMRPVEAVAPEMFKDTSDSRVENAGPLAGLRGALPAEISLKETHKPPPYTLKLAIPEDQAARLEMLKGLLADETEPRPLPGQAAISSQLLMRVLIFLAFVAAAIYAMWAGPQASTQLSSIQATQPVIDFQSHLASIQPGSPVLVAFDFEPGYSTEIEASLEAVLNELATLNGPVFTVSTSTSGAIQAERLMAKVNGQVSRQQAPYTGMKNLGFLPGGPAGMLSFVADPAHTIPLDINNGRPWVEIAQEGEGGLASFAAVIVATDRAETARTWIEQTGPGLQQSGTSLLMVTSAQVEPLVQAYYSADPQLVNGYISGLTGGATYENLVGLPGAASSALDGFSAVVLAGLLAIMIGGLASLLVGSAPSKSEPKPIVEEKA